VWAVTERDPPQRVWEVGHKMNTISWTPQEAASINEFLSTPLGQKWLGILIMRKPRLDVSSTERAALSGALAAGYEQAFNEIHATRVTIQPDSASAQPINPAVD
jgi:hypothetical protein